MVTSNQEVINRFNYFIQNDSGVSLLAPHSLSTDEYLSQLAPVLQTAIEEDMLDDFLERLNTATADKEQELSNICNGTHNDMLLTTNSLSLVVNESKNISQDLLLIRKQFNNTGLNLSTVSKQFLDSRFITDKLFDLKIELSSCLKVLELTNKVHEMIKGKKYFIALKAIDDLSNIHIKQVLDYSFAKRINDSIDTLKQMIKDHSMSDVKRLMNDIEHSIDDIGTNVFNNTNNLYNKWLITISKDNDLQDIKFNSVAELCLREASYSNDENDIFDPLKNNQININLTPLYDAILSYQTLHAMDQLKEQFNNEFERRRKRLLYQLTNGLINGSRNTLVEDEDNPYDYAQLKISQEAKLNNPLESDSKDDNEKTNAETSMERWESFNQLLEKVTGFMVAYREAMGKTEYKLISEDEMTNHWNATIQSLINSLTAFISHESDQQRLAKIQSKIATFLLSLENYQYNVEELHVLLIFIFQKYSSLLKQNFENEFKQSLIEDDYIPMQINDESLFKKIIKISFVNKENDKDKIIFSSSSKLSFPKILPFSKLYPLTCTQILKFIQTHYNFLKDLTIQNSNQLNEIFINAINDVLINIVCNTLVSQLDFATKDQIVQNLTNLEYFYMASLEIQKIISTEKNFSNRPIKIDLRATTNFKLAKKKAEEKIFEMVHSKISDFVEVSFWDWRTRIKSEEPSLEIVDMTGFLDMFFSSTLATIPLDIKQVMYMDAFKHMSRLLMIHLIDESGTSITLEAVYNFNIDVSFLEDFSAKFDSLLNNNDINKDKNKHNEDDDPLSLKASDLIVRSTFKIAFIELRETINLILFGNEDEYDDIQIRLQRYKSVKPSNAKRLFTKLKVGNSSPSPSQQNKSKFSKYYRMAQSRLG